MALAPYLLLIFFHFRNSLSLSSSACAGGMDAWIRQRHYPLQNTWNWRLCLKWKRVVNLLLQWMRKMASSDSRQHLGMRTMISLVTETGKGGMQNHQFSVVSIMMTTAMMMMTMATTMMMHRHRHHYHHHYHYHQPPPLPPPTIIIINHHHHHHYQHYHHKLEQLDVPVRYYIQVLFHQSWGTPRSSAVVRHCL